MKKFVFIFFSVIFLFVFAGTGKVEELELVQDGKTAILIDANTGYVMYEKDQHITRHPASMTKIMSMYLILEAIERGSLNWDEVITISSYAASMGGSQIWLETGEKMTVEDLFKAIALASANDATVALAERVAGTEKAFVDMMNNRVKEWGLKETHFVDTTGLTDDDHYSSAYDMAMMGRKLLNDYEEEVTRFTSKYEDYVRDGDFWLVNTNKLVKFIDGVDGLKTGHTTKALYCLTATQKKSDMRLIAVVMGGTTTTKRNSEIVKLLNYGFNMYITKNLFEADKVVGEYKSVYTKPHQVNIVTTDSLYKTELKTVGDYEVTHELELDRLKPGVKHGETVGKLVTYIDGQRYNEIPVTVQEDLNKAGFFEVMRCCLRSIFYGDVL